MSQSSGLPRVLRSDEAPDDDNKGVPWVHAEQGSARTSVEGWGVSVCVCGGGFRLLFCQQVIKVYLYRVVDQELGSK